MALAFVSRGVFLRRAPMLESGEYGNRLDPQADIILRDSGVMPDRDIGGAIGAGFALKAIVRLSRCRQPR